VEEGGMNEQNYHRTEKRTFVEATSLKTVKGLIALLMTGLLVGCASGVRNWQEQVILPDGRELIVERSHTLSNRFDREISAINAPPSATAYTVAIPLPNGGKAIWEAEHMNMIPIAVTTDSKTAYLIASPFNCKSYARLGRPEPPFAVFKYEGNRWARVAIEMFPGQISEANLMIDTSNQEIEKSPISAKTVKRLNEGIVRRLIYRQGIDKYLWGRCLYELDRGWDAQERKMEK